MWILNTDKNIILELEKLTFHPWEVVKGKVKFDFWDEKIKADRIAIQLVKNASSSNINFSQNSISYKKNTKKYHNIVNKTLAWKGEYSKEEFNFSFVLPSNILPQSLDIEWLLAKFNVPKNFANVLVTLFNFLGNKSKIIYDFKIVARIDIPWWIDITESVNINIENK